MYGESCPCPVDKVNMTNPVRIGATSKVPGNQVTCLSIEGGFSIFPIRIISSQIINANGTKLWRTLTRDNAAAVVDAGNLCTFSGCVQHDSHVGFTQASYVTISNQRTKRKLNTSEPNPSTSRDR